MSSTLLMDKEQLARTIRRLTYEILEKNGGSSELLLIGVLQKGLPFMRRLAQVMEEVEQSQVDYMALDISPFRDDEKKKGVKDDLKPYDLRGRTVILIDDVLHTGRSVRAALDGVMHMGRPEAIQLAVLIDRGHRELPIRADFVGKNVPTAKDEQIRVYLDEKDRDDCVILYKK